MNSSNLRRQDTTKGPPLRILSLDGGGVRGYSMLILLQELMHRTYVEIHGDAPRRHEIPKPCDHFDLIAGTGTGGLIAIMLGRLRLDLETCMDVYVRMTKKVFETDKTFAGIPYRSTLFKASKLEEAIRECVREHTIFDDEGKDDASPTPPTSLTPAVPQRAASSASRNSAYTPVTHRGNTGSARAWGNPNARLYDIRECRTKTAVTAVYKGTPLSGSSALLRSYDSRKEPAPEFDCTIWQAGRATSATGLAFKPIQIGQSVFIDEGAGKYNPSPQILDEAAINEWPGRDVGVFVSIGTGKRPSGTNHSQTQWWEGFVETSVGEFAEARRRLISKIEGCEEIHKYMIRDHLSKRGVNAENYYRLNVEIGVGEFAMNEWGRLAEISTSTRMYIARQEVQSSIVSAASKISRIHRAKLRYEKLGDEVAVDHRYSWDESAHQEPAPPSHPMAAELPTESYYELDAGPLPYRVRQYQEFGSQGSIHHVGSPVNNDTRPTGMTNHPSQIYHQQQQQQQPQYQQQYQPPQTNQQQQQLPQQQTQPQYQLQHSPRQPQPRLSTDSYNYETSTDRPPPLHVHHNTPPPVPPKTPISAPDDGFYRQPLKQPSGAARSSLPPPLPYPDLDGPPPEVNMARKPQYGIR